MTLVLRDHLHWCDCNGRAIFLDLLSDRYFCLPEALNAAFLRFGHGAPWASDEKFLAPLVKRGLLVMDRSAPSAAFPPQIKRPTRDFRPDGVRRMRVAANLGALVAELEAIWLLRTRSLDQVIDRLKNERERSRPACEPTAVLELIVESSAAMALLTREHDRCLVRAIAAYRRCRQRGIGATLVFGVCAVPFAAHCWVQYESLVLVGGFEHARLYTPILVVE